MAEMRSYAAEYADRIEDHVPDGPDKTFILRSLRTVAMWVNVAITRDADGTPIEAGTGRHVTGYPPDHPAPGDLGSVPL